MSQRLVLLIQRFILLQYFTFLSIFLSQLLNNYYNNIYLILSSKSSLKLGVIIPINLSITSIYYISNKQLSQKYTLVVASLVASYYSFKNTINSGSIYFSSTLLPFFFRYVVYSIRQIILRYLSFILKYKQYLYFTLFLVPAIVI